MASQKKFSIFQRLVIANILYSLPIIGLIYLMVGAQNVNIDFAVQELKGNEIQRPLEVLLKSVTQARMAVVKNDVDASSFSNVEEAINKLHGPMKSLSEDLQFNEEGLKKRNRAATFLPEFEKRWKAYVEEFGKLPAKDRLNKMNAFVADARTMITHAGDTSNLILDPDLDSYYLMDITLVGLPQNQDRISEVLTFLRGLDFKNLSAQEKIQTAVYSALLKQSDLDRITGDLQTTLNEDANFYGVSPTLKSKLAPALSGYQSATENFVDLLNKLATSPTAPSLSELDKAGQAAFTESFSSWEVAVGELDLLLQTRIHDLTAYKWKSLGLALLALAMAVCVLFWISSAFNRNMTTVISQLKHAVLKTRESGMDLVTLSRDLSVSSTEQASALQETSAAIDEINSMIQSTISNTRVAKDIAHASVDSANQGHQSVQRLMGAIGEIAESNQRVLGEIENSRKEMTEITNIISAIGARTKVINDIVFQTKLLSFNASVEAARAGEAGKGFAVVAEEVGNLAQMSGSASKEIAEMLDSSISQVQNITNTSNVKVTSLIETSRVSVESGSDLAGETTQSISAALKKVEEVLGNVEQIQRAAEEQARGIAEITKAVHQLDSISHKNTEMSEKTASQSRQIAEQADSLNSIVRLFQHEVLGRADNSEPGEAA